MIKQLKRIGFVIICGLAIPIIGVTYLGLSIYFTVASIVGVICSPIEYVITGKTSILKHILFLPLYNYPNMLDKFFCECIKSFDPDSENNENSE